MNHARIEAWWNDLNKIIPTNVPRLQQWLRWWVKKQHIWLITLWMNLTMRKRLWCQQPILLKVSIFIHTCVWVSIGNGCKVKTYLYITNMDDMVRFMLQQQFYHMFLFGNKVGTRPTKVDLFLGATSCSPNLDTFVKAIYNVVFGSPLHSKGIILEGKASLMFVERKLDGNSHKLDKSIFIINISAMTNCLTLSTHQSLDPLCIPFLVPQPNLGNIN